MLGGGTPVKPDNTSAIMSSAAEARDKERRRVKQGLMDGLGRLVVYVDKLPEGETQRWWQIKVKDLSWIPPGIEANLRLPKTVRKTRVELQLGKDGDPFKALVFARVEDGKGTPGFPLKTLASSISHFLVIPQKHAGFKWFFTGVSGVEADDVDTIFLQQIGKTFDEMMKGKKNNPASRCGVYADLTKVFPEGIFKGFTYPNVRKGEDYTLRVLSGKRGETGSISVLETSDSNSSGRAEIDLGSGADTDDEDKEYEESVVISWVFLNLPLPCLKVSVFSRASFPPASRKRWAGETPGKPPRVHRAKGGAPRLPTLRSRLPPTRLRPPPRPRWHHLPTRPATFSERNPQRTSFLPPR